jgi:hypothetical protein
VAQRYPGPKGELVKVINILFDYEAEYTLVYNQWLTKRRPGLNSYKAKSSHHLMAAITPNEGRCEEEIITSKT